VKQLEKVNCRENHFN